MSKFRASDNRGKTWIPITEEQVDKYSRDGWKIVENADDFHKSQCYGGLSTQDLMVVLVLLGLDIHQDYSGDGKTMAEGLGPELMKQVLDRVTAIKTEAGSAVTPLSTFSAISAAAGRLRAKNPPKV